MSTSSPAGRGFLSSARRRTSNIVLLLLVLVAPVKTCVPDNVQRVAEMIQHGSPRGAQTGAGIGQRSRRVDGRVHIVKTRIGHGRLGSGGDQNADYLRMPLTRRHNQQRPIAGVRRLRVAAVLHIFRNRDGILRAMRLFHLRQQRPRAGDVIDNLGGEGGAAGVAGRQQNVRHSPHRPLLVGDAFSGPKRAGGRVVSDIAMLKMLYRPEFGAQRSPVVSRPGLFHRVREMPQNIQRRFPRVIQREGAEIVDDRNMRNSPIAAVGKPRGGGRPGGDQNADYLRVPDGRRNYQRRNAVDSPVRVAPRAQQGRDSGGAGGAPRLLYLIKQVGWIHALVAGVGGGGLPGGTALGRSNGVGARGNLAGAAV